MTKVADPDDRPLHMHGNLGRRRSDRNVAFARRLALKFVEESIELTAKLPSAVLGHKCEHRHSGEA
jgi:hypothetical protein